MEIIRNYAHADAEVKLALPKWTACRKTKIRVTLIATGLGGGKENRARRTSRATESGENGTDGTHHGSVGLPAAGFRQTQRVPRPFGPCAPQPVDFLIRRWAIRSIFRLSCAARLIEADCLCGGVCLREHAPVSAPVRLVRCLDNA